jgi:hypothetical protein
MWPEGWHFPVHFVTGSPVQNTISAAAAAVRFAVVDAIAVAMRGGWDPCCAHETQPAPHP